MHTKLSTAATIFTTAVLWLAPAAPALAQEADGGAKPWHYWVAPLLLIGGIVVIAAFALGYWIRVMGGRSRR